MHKKAALSIFEQFFFSFVSFLIVAVLARSNEFESLALYNKYMIITTFFVMLTNSGIVTFLNSFASNAIDKLVEDNVKKTASLLSVLIAIVGLASGGGYFRDQSISLAIFFSLLIMSCVVREISRKLNFYNESYTRILLTMIVSGAGVSSTLYLYVIGVVSGIEFLSFGLIFSAFVPALFFPIKVFFSGRTSLKTDDIRFIGYQSVSGFLLWGGVNLYLLASDSMLSIEENSIIRAMITIGSVIGMVILSLESFLPKVMAKKNTIGLKHVFYTGSVLLGLLLIFVSVFSQEVIHTLLGEGFSDHSFALIMVVVWQGIGLYAYVMQVHLRKNNKAQYISLAYVVFFLSSLVFSNFLISSFSIYGVFYGLILSQVLYFSVLCYFFLKMVLK